MQIEGFKIIWPEGKKAGDEIEISLKPGEDHIIVLRRTESKSAWNLTNRTSDREMADNELITKVKE